MAKIDCVKMKRGAHHINVSAVTQEALNKAGANLPQDQPCILLAFYTQGGGSSGARLTINQAEELALAVLAGAVGIRQSAEAARHAHEPPSPTNNKPAPLTLGQRVRELRIARGWSRADLAARSGCTDNLVFRVESGESIPHHVNLRKIEKALDVQDHELMTMAAEVRAGGRAAARRPA